LTASGIGAPTGTLNQEILAQAAVWHKGFAGPQRVALSAVSKNISK